MAFGAKNIPPIDTRPSIAIGVSIPFNGPATFFQTYTTKNALKNNIINLLLTNKAERILNNRFGANLRKYIFELITSGTIAGIENKIQSVINVYYPEVTINNVEVNRYPDNNQIEIQIYYSILNNGTDKITITLS